MSPAQLESKIEKANERIEEIQFLMIEAEGEEYDELADELEQLEDKLVEYQLNLESMDAGLALLDGYDE